MEKRKNKRKQYDFINFQIKKFHHFRHLQILKILNIGAWISFHKCNIKTIWIKSFQKGNKTPTHTDINQQIPRILYSNHRMNKSYVQEI